MKYIGLIQILDFDKDGIAYVEKFKKMFGITCIEIDKIQNDLSNYFDMFYINEVDLLVLKKKQKEAV